MLARSLHPAPKSPRFSIPGRLGLTAWLACALPCGSFAQEATRPEARNAIFFVGDGMGISTVTAARVFSVGVDGQLALDTMPFHALSRTASSDSITADSAATMSAMITGVSTNNGVISMGAESEPADFNMDGDGPPATTLFELAKAAGKRIGVVTTTRVTHATPAACYAHGNHRDAENDFALQALPTDASYNPALLGGLDLLAGGGRRQFLDASMTDEEGEAGRRSDGRDLRAEFQAANYEYVWNAEQWSALGVEQLPVLALFNSSHMEYEHDRALDLGGEPSLVELTLKAVELLEASADDNGWLLLVEAGRIDHAHHGGNAFRALRETEQLDRAVEAASAAVNLEETLVLVTADHSHGFVLAGYPLRPLEELPYKPRDWDEGFATGSARDRLLDVAYHLNARTGEVRAARDANGVPYTALLYASGPGSRTAARVDPREDKANGWFGAEPTGPRDPNYRQEAHVPLSSETHGGEDVSLYGVGAGSHRVRGTLSNTEIFQVMRRALGL
ncbi:MAG: alkaline phosphatase [Planctomycetota bacterium]|nr:MAG: alkaline phosphatase [Planctomycetota bacterium]